MLRILDLIVFLCQVYYVFCYYEIYGDFKECLVSTTLNMLQFDNECFRDPDNYVKSFDADFANFDKNYPSFVFSKHNFKLESKGFECRMIIRRYRYSRDFLFNKYVQSDIQNVKLTRSDCMVMVQDKKCGRSSRKMNMPCNSKNDCFYKDEIVDEYPFYFGTIEKEFYDCMFNEKIVMAQSLESNVFLNSIEPCYAEDEVCYFADSTVIWEREDIRKCTLERLIELSTMSMKQNSNSTIFYSERDQYLFKLTQKEEHCGLSFYLTTEGLYLAFHNNDKEFRNRLLELPLSKYSINHFIDKDKNDLILAENDYSKFKMTEMMLDIACSMFLNSIQLNQNHDDKFLTINYLGRKNVIIYIKNGQAFLPICTNISYVLISGDVSKSTCQNDIEINYALNNKSSKLERGFLRENNIITQYSQRLDDCEHITKSLIVVPEIGKKPILIKRNRTNIQVKNFETQITEFKLSAASLNDLYNHHDYLVNGSDFYEKINDFFEPTNTIVIENGKSSNYFDPDTILINKDPFKDLSNGVSKFFKKKFFYYIKIVFVILILSSISLCSFNILLNFKRTCFKPSFAKINHKENIDIDLNIV